MSSEQAGQTLIEALITVSIAGLLLSGFVFGAIFFVRTASASKYRAWASSLAQEKMEQLRDQQSNDPTTFWDMVDDDPPVDQVEELTSPSLFTRTTSFDYELIDGISRRVKITVTVSWQGGQRDLSVTSYFTD
ncbi:MAG: prepilin-type N-terminal cleavage/methylation domain-containing protein [Patescibacteria group bacterium]